MFKLADRGLFGRGYLQFIKTYLISHKHLCEHLEELMKVTSLKKFLFRYQIFY